MVLMNRSEPGHSYADIQVHLPLRVGKSAIQLTDSLSILDHLCAECGLGLPRLRNHNAITIGFERYR